MVVAPLFVALTSAGAADATGTSSAGASVVMRAKPTAPAPRTTTTMYKSRVLSSGSFEYGNVACTCMLAHFCTFSHTSLVVCCQWLTLVPLPHSIAWLSTETRQSTLLINDSLMIKVLREVVTCLVNLIL